MTTRCRDCGHERRQPDYACYCCQLDHRVLSRSAIVLIGALLIVLAIVLLQGA